LTFDVIFDFLMSRIENLNRVSTRNQYQIESECWNQVFKLSQKIDIEYSSRVRRLISKLDLMISLHIIDAVTHEKNWLQSISTWEMSIQCCYDDVQVQQRLNVDQAHFINMSQMKSRIKSNAMKREHHELEKALRNHECSNDDHSNDTLNEHTESISSCDSIKELNERERK